MRARVIYPPEELLKWGVSITVLYGIRQEDGKVWLKVEIEEEGLRKLGVPEFFIKGSKESSKKRKGEINEKKEKKENSENTKNSSQNMGGNKKNRLIKED